MDERDVISFSQDDFTGSGGAVSLSDSELNAVTGGLDVVFRDGLNRDSWFVSYMMRRMVLDSINRQLAAGQGTLPGEISVRGRMFRVTQLGDQILVEAAP